MLVTCWNSLVTCCKITPYSLQNSLVTLCGGCSLEKTTLYLPVAKFTRYSLQKLFVAKLTRYSLQNSLFTRCRSCSLQNITRYSLQNLLVTCCRSCSLQETTRYLLQNLLVTRCRSWSVLEILVTCCKICLLRVAEVARCKRSLVTCKIRSLLVAKNHSL